MSPFKLLIACDADTDVAAIAADLRRAGLPLEVHAVVLCVADLLPIPETSDSAGKPAAVRKARERTARALQEMQLVADRAAARFREVFPDWRIATEVQADAPAWAIVKKADQWHADLIVLCSHNPSLLHRLLLGSVSQSVLTHASGSVRIVRARRVEPTVASRILVGMDGSPGAEAAAAAVAARSWPPGSEVMLLSVFDETLGSMLGFTDESGDQPDVAARLARRTAESLGRAGLIVSTAMVADGNPKDVLVKEADRWDATCLFVGARGLRAVDRFLLGSVSASVAARAHCSVEVVRQ